MVVWRHIVVLVRRTVIGIEPLLSRLTRALSVVRRHFRCDSSAIEMRIFVTSGRCEIEPLKCFD